MFLIFDPKHTVCVLVRTASASEYFEQKTKKKKTLLVNVSIFTAEKISVYCMGKFS